MGRHLSSQSAGAAASRQASAANNPPVAEKGSTVTRADTPAISSGSGGNQYHIKITSLAIKGAQDRAEAKDASIHELPLTTFTFTGGTPESFASQTKLAHIRLRIDEFTASKKTPFKFCTTGCSVVEDELSLQEYLQLSENSIHSNGSESEVFVMAFESSDTSTSILAKPPFLIKFLQKTEGSMLSEGSLHSSAFRGKNAAALLLGELRKMIKKMSQDVSMHTFCSNDGTAVGDELNLGDYLHLDDAPVTNESGVPSIHVTFRKGGSPKFEPPAAPGEGPSRQHGASAEVLAKLDEMKPDLTFRDRSAEELKMDTSEFRVKEELDASQFAGRNANPAKFVSLMDENDWNQVLRNCSLLFGWKVDKKTNKIMRATTPAFRLRTNMQDPEPLPAIEDSPTSYEVSSIPEQAGPDLKSAPAKPAKSPASAASDTGYDTNEDSAYDEVHSEITAVEAVDEKPITADDLRAVKPEKPGVLPSFLVNDNSKIEVSVVSHEFQKSMAENHFSASSVEASVSGGYGGISAGVSGGYASESASGKSSSDKSYSKTMVATYKFPRVTMFLRPEDMEPTDELKAALDSVRKTKNISSLRKLHQTFGHLFCGEATLGGCLQTTKVVTGTERGTQTMQKEGFKAQVGVAVSTPYGGASVKASHEKQDKVETGEKKTDTSEAMVFEATGGNTILAADPPSWSASVADFQNWRVIDQSGLAPLADVISEIPGYGNVRQWFLQAVPKLSEYVVIPESRLLNVRFKVLGDGALSRIAGQAECAYLGHDPDEKKAPRPIRVSLEQKAPMTDIQKIVRSSPWGATCDMTTLTTQAEVTINDTMFYPHSTQAPVLMFPGLSDANKANGVTTSDSAPSDIVTNDAVGTLFDQGLRQTVWRLEIPEKYSLGSDCKICIKSIARTKTVEIPPTVPPKPNEPPPPPNSSEVLLPAALTVYRNQQGVFLPAISSSDDPSYWRIERVASGGGGRSDARIKHGEEIRLCWRFSDQVSGFRDYCDDLYGRRRYTKPTECDFDALYFKAPYPRFEGLQAAGMAMVMSPAETKDPVIETLRVLPRKTEAGEQQLNYAMHDLTFRLDAVGDGGFGDAPDYMNIVTSARTENVLFKELSKELSRWNEYSESRPTFAETLLGGGPESVIAGAILGPMAAPISAIANVIGSIFDW